jgi:hypothetical protein
MNRYEYDEDIAGGSSGTAALTTAAQTSVAFGIERIKGVLYHAWEVIWPANATVGEVIIEASHDVAYTGTWHPISTVGFSAASKVDIVTFTGSLRATRARVSTTVTGDGVRIRQRGVRP